MELLWRIIAWLVSRKPVREWLIKQAMKRPYQHILSPDKSEVYMYRFWLFNPYPTQKVKDEYKAAGKKLPWQFPISIRLHRIMVPDDDRALHDHPWNARTIILQNWYDEIRREYHPPCAGLDWSLLPECWINNVHTRNEGDTATLKFGEYHRIAVIHPDGVWTLFITGPQRGDWGYLVNGEKVNFRDYNREGTVVDHADVPKVTM